MSLDACIPELVADGTLDREDAAYVTALYAKLRARQRETFGKYAADAAAGYQTLEQLDRTVRQQRRNALLDVSVKKAALEAMGKYRSRAGKFDWGRAAEALFAQDDRAPYANVEYQEHVRRGQALALVDDVLRRHGRNVLGQIKDSAGLKDLLRELRGEATGNDVAAELARAVEQAQDLQLAQFNAAGGAVRKLPNRGVAQSWYADKVTRAGKAAWKADIGPRLDPTKMIDNSTGEAMTPEAIDKLLDQVFDTIRTQGAGTREEGAFGGMSLAKSRQEHRVLIFRSADDWLEAAEKYGNVNVYDAIMNEIHGFARDIAQMEILGPNPSATVRWLKDVVKNRALLEHGAGSNAVARAQASVAKIDTYWNVLSGGAGQGERNWLSLIGSGLRAHQTYTKLGGASVTALPTDMATQALTRAFNGIPAASTAFDVLKAIASKGDREGAARMGFVSEISGGNFSTQARLWNQELTGEFQSRLAEGIMRASGLNLVTDAGRAAFVWETLGHITDELRNDWGAIDGRFRRMFERYGVGEADWAAMQAAPPMNMQGAKFFHPDQLDDSRLGDTIMRMIYTERDFAVVTPGLRVRSVVEGFGRRGTWPGEVARSLFQFKAFPLTILYMHGARMLALQGGWSKALYAASFVSMSTLAGWMALEAKAILKGQDPRPLTLKTLLASAQQGGGLGIYGDFLFGSTNRAGQGFSSTLLGPSAATADAVSGLLVGSPLLMAQDEKVNYGRQLVRLLRSETPGGSLWYARLAFDRLILDQAQAMADPNYHQSWRQMEKRAGDMGTDYWWRPGETSPGRTPELGNVLENQP